MTAGARGGWRAAGRLGQAGGAAVEFAMVLPLFLGVVMGALDYGYYFFSEQVATNSAREGARAGTLVDPGSDPLAPANQPTAVGNAVSAATQYMTNNGVSCTSCIGARVCPGGATSGVAISGSCPAVAGGGFAIEVQIKYPAVSLTGFTQVILPRHVFGDSVMVWR